MTSLYLSSNICLTSLDNRAANLNTVGDSRFDSTNQYSGSTTGPHSSNLANKVDPRVDSDMTSRTCQPGETFDTYNTSTSTNAGPHDSNMANKLDPRVDSDMDNRAQHDALAGSSYANPAAGATAGPHSSNVANKLDPRVDSDIDNRGIGGQRNLY